MGIIIDVPPLSNGVASINPQLGAGNVARSFAQKESDRPHQILRLPHFSLWDQGGPMLEELWVVVEDFGGPIVYWSERLNIKSRM